MAGKKISDLTNLGAAPASNDVVPIVDSSGSATKKVTIEDLFTNPNVTGTLTVDNSTTTPVVINRDQAIDGYGLILNQPNTTDGNGLEISYQTTTTGTVTPNTLFAGIDFTADTHDWSTRLGSIQLKTAQGGVGYKTRLNVAGNGDVSLFEDTGTTAKFHWDASAETIAIGGSSMGFFSGSGLSLYDGTATRLRMGNATTGTGNGDGLDINVVGSDASINLREAGNLRFFTSATERVTIDSSGNVGIGTTSPSAIFESQANVTAGIFTSTSTNLHTADAVLRVRNTGDTAVNTKSHRLLDLDYAGDASGVTGEYIRFLTGGTQRLELGLANDEFTISQNGSERMRIDSSGNVGIGKTSPSVKLDTVETFDTVSNILSNGTYAAKFTGSSSGGVGRSQGIILSGSDSSLRGAAIVAECQTTGNDHDLIFATSAVGSAPTEHMRIDSTGNLLVGKTSSDIATSGVELSPTDRSSFTRASGFPILVNRTVSDGEIINIRKDGTTVGSIGTYVNQITIGKGSTGLLFDGSTKIFPWNVGTNSSADNQMDLGTVSTRFQNLYLSGGVYLGGTGAANLLDDYEKSGTFVPEVRGTTTAGTATYVTQECDYIKVGDLVWFGIRVNYSGHTGTGNMQITLPFTSSSASNYYPVSVLASNITMPSSTRVTAMVIPNNPTLAMYTESVGTSGGSGLLSMDAAGELFISGCFFVA